MSILLKSVVFYTLMDSFPEDFQCFAPQGFEFRINQDDRARFEDDVMRQTRQEIYDSWTKAKEENQEYCTINLSHLESSHLYILREDFFSRFRTYGYFSHTPKVAERAGEKKILKDAK